MKQVPKTDVDLEIDSPKDRLKENNLVFDVNEFDDYALEAALQLKEQHGADVTLLTMGPNRARETMHVGLAKGADRAIHLDDSAFEEADAYATSNVLTHILKKLHYDLILTGVEATDDIYGQVGVTIAEKLGLAHATVVTKLDLEEGGKRIRVRRELGGGLLEVMDVSLPAVLTIQLGIYKLRYASMRGIAKARQKEIKTLKLADVGLSPEQVGKSGSKVKLREIYFPPKGKGAEIIAGKPEEAARTLMEKLRVQAKVL
ncbi:MAG: electron transfer flavoprotein subunit beta/FixA family protein [Candidatus Bathyarchaeia archaeon]